MSVRGSGPSADARLGLQGLHGARGAFGGGGVDSLLDVVTGKFADVRVDARIEGSAAHRVAASSRLAASADGRDVGAALWTPSAGSRRQGAGAAAPGLEVAKSAHWDEASSPQRGSADSGDTSSTGGASVQRSTLSSCGAAQIADAFSPRPMHYAWQSTASIAAVVAESAAATAAAIAGAPRSLPAVPPAWGRGVTRHDRAFLVNFCVAFCAEGGKQCGDADFGIVAKIGQGAVGEVFIAGHLASGLLVAMKRVQKAILMSRSKVARAFMERAVCMSVGDARFLCESYCVYQTADHLVYCNRLCAGGTLFSYLQRRGALSRKEVIGVAAELLVALEELHDRGFVHRDLKPENVLIDGHGHIALADYDLCERLGADETEKGGTLCGTLEYLAPEMIEGETYRDVSIDLWGLGVMIYEMLTSRTPWYTENASRETIVRRILKKSVKFDSTLFSDHLADFVRRLLIRDRCTRLRNTRALRHHPVFAGILWDTLHKRPGPLRVDSKVSTCAKPPLPAPVLERNQVADMQNQFRCFSAWTRNHIRRALRKHRDGYKDIELV